MNKFQMRGAEGELKRGYLCVARLESWSWQEQRIEATAHDINTFHLEQGGLTLRLKVGDDYRVWKDVEILDVGPAPMVFRVEGRPERRP